MQLRHTLSQTLSAAFEKCGYDPKYGDVTVSNRPDLCQFQCNGAMAAAKAYKKPPSAIASEVAAAATAAMFEMFFGGDVEGRKVYIAENGAKYLELADIS